MLDAVPMRTVRMTFVYAFTIVAMVSATAIADTPNILLILADDVGYGDLGCYGNRQVATPHIDRLAAEGRRFTDAHSASAVCTPSRYALLTGEYPFRQNLWGPAGSTTPLLVDPARTTLAQLLKSRGYATACIGKWHLGFGLRAQGRKSGPDWNGELVPGPLELGFDHYFGLPIVNSIPPYVWVENRRVVALDPDDPIVQGGVQYAQRFPEKGLGKIGGGRAAHAAYRDRQAGATLVNKSKDWIRAHRDRPFFLYLATTHIHHPFTPADRFVGSTPIGRYGDFLAELDWMVGEVLDELDAVGLICLIDMLPTCAALTGAPLPPGAGSDGVDILPALIGDPPTPVRQELVISPYSAKHLAIRSGRWIYIGGQGGGGFTQKKPGDHALGGPAALAFAGEPNSDVADGKLRPDAPPAQLYDLEADPRQASNVIHMYSEVAARLRNRLNELQAAAR
jgi:arylsulfatase A-like enzyme